MARRNGYIGRLWALALGFLAVGLIGSAQAADPGTLAISTQIDRPILLKGDQSPVYVLIRIDAPDMNETGAAGIPADRPPLNLALALDRSGSMADAGKLDYLKKAAGGIVDLLAPADVLSIVEYDDQLTLLWPAAPVGSPARVKDLIDGLTPRGSTDLAGGMMKAIAEAQKAEDRGIVAGNALSRVILLSDGLANHGVTDPAAIGALVRKAKGAGVSISALGLGRDYDEDLMQAIAENGGGRYYYIENPDQIGRIFAEEMNTLFRLTAKNVRVAFEPSAEAEGAKILGFDGAVAELGDLAVGEKRAVILRISHASQPLGVHGLGKVKISYLDVRTGERHNSDVNLSVNLTEDEGVVRRAVNREAVIEAALAQTEEGQKEAVKRLQAGDRAGAERQMGQLVQALDGKQAQLKDKRLEKKLEGLSVERADMAETARVPASGSEYLKRTKQRLYQAKLGARTLSQLQEGDRGYEVERLQEALIKSGYYKGPIDGVFSASVTEAVKAFQKSENIGPDGIAGPSTMKELGLY
jgi:Ca-activated chloride channel family protein